MVSIRQKNNQFSTSSAAQASITTQRLTVEAVDALELLNQGNIALLGILGGDALVDQLLPGALLGLALYFPPKC